MKLLSQGLNAAIGVISFLLILVAIVELHRSERQQEVRLVFYEAHRESEIRCLALNVWHEARGEPLVGQIMVAQVTMNRARNPAYPKSVCDVVYQRNTRGCQFSWTCDDARAIYEEIEGTRSDLVARAVYGGTIVDLTDGATNYHARSVRPAWRRSMQAVGAVGGHHFYVDPKTVRASR